jgi:hypothetical protein
MMSTMVVKGALAKAELALHLVNLGMAGAC